MRGFTLIELLIVIVVLGILMGFVLPPIVRVLGRTHITETKVLINGIEGALSAYESETGDYPPTSLRDMDIGTNGINDGIESLVASLTSQTGSGPYFEEISEKNLGNTDADLLPAEFIGNSYLGRKALEIVDHWGNPLVYIHHRDYANPPSYMRLYKLADKKNINIKPSVSKVTGGYASPLKYQIWSFGPNGKNENGEGDDITSWK